MASSSEFQLPAGDTRSEADPGGKADSTLELGGIPAAGSDSQKRDPGSTIFNVNKPMKEKGTRDIPDGAVLGDFKVEKPIGEGSMGEVYKATQTSLGRTVALKILPKEFAGNRTLLERFLREARSLAALDHPHIVKVHATGELDGRYYAALEFIDGVTLQKVIDHEKRLTVGDALHITLVCASALEHAHELGIIHRDVKPSNVLVSRNGIAKVADFGLVKMVDADMSMTATGTGLGTPEYMAPEQSYDARNASAAADVYSLGIMLYVMLTGELPFKGESMVDFLSAKQSGKFDPARSVNPEVPERLDLIIHKALVAEPKQRYANCTEFIRDLATLHRQNDSLSFVDVKKPYVAYGAWSKTPADTATKPSSRTSRQAAPDPASVANPTGQEFAGSDEVEAKNWYVAHKNRLGKTVLSRMMTADLILALERKLIPPSAQIKAAQNQPFRPLGNYPEFHPVLTRLGVRIQKAPTQQKGTGRRKKRRKKKSDTADLALRIVVGLCASYGLIRVVMDTVGAFREEPPAVEEKEKGPADISRLL